MKKRLLAMAIVAIMVTGCGKNANTDNVNEQASAAEQSSVEAAAAEQTSEDASATEQTSEDAAATEQTSEDAAATAQTSEVASATEQASKETAATEQASKETAATEQASEQPAQDNKKEEKASAGLKDGSYTTNLVSEPYSFSPGYVKSITVTDDAVIIEGDVYQYDANWKTVDFGSNTYTLPITADTQYLSSGGEEAAKHMSKDDFANKFPNLIGSGLGLSFEIKNGSAVSFNVFS